MNELKNSRISYEKNVESLLKYGTDINAKEMINKFTPLHRAAENGEFSFLTREIVFCFFFVQITILNLDLGHVKMVEFLLKNNANFTAEAINHLIPLNIATVNGEWLLIEWLKYIIKLII